MTTLDGQRILIAGGTGTIGQHLVAAVLDAGATAIVTSRSTQKLDELRQRHRSAPGRLVALEGDIGDEREGPELVKGAGQVHGAVASIGDFVALPPEGILAAPPQAVQRALDGSIVAHLAAARAIVPALEASGGSYVMLQGPLAHQPLFPFAGLVSVATAGQAMLARVLMDELADRPLRVNELVIYASLGWGADEESRISGADIGRYVTYLLSDRAAHIRGRSIHLMAPTQVPALASS